MSYYGECYEYNKKRCDYCSCCEPFYVCCKGDTGPVGPQGPVGLQGPVGPQGEPGEVGPILQHFVNANILNTQTIPANGAVRFPDSTDTANFSISGVRYNGSDTFTIVEPGLYALVCSLSLGLNNSSDNVFSIEINGAPTASVANLNQTGSIVLNRVNHHAAGTTIRIINRAAHEVTISNANGYLSSTGHLSLYRFADGGIA